MPDSFETRLENQILFLIDEMHRTRALNVRPDAPIRKGPTLEDIAIHLGVPVQQAREALQRLSGKRLLRTDFSHVAPAASVDEEQALERASFVRV